LEIELTYDDDVMHCGEVDQEAKAWFYQTLLFPQDRLILHSNDIGDEVGEVKVKSIANASIERPMKPQKEDGSDALLACPFCGAPGTFEPCHGGVRIGCRTRGCIAEVVWGAKWIDDRNGVEAWNRRANAGTEVRGNRVA
jgi:hypothetical protein